MSQPHNFMILVNLKKSEFIEAKVVDTGEQIKNYDPHEQRRGVDFLNYYF